MFPLSLKLTIFAFFFFPFDTTLLRFKPLNVVVDGLSFSHLEGASSEPRQIVGDSFVTLRLAPGATVGRSDIAQSGIFGLGG